jgi:anaerobic magnesium-protoporphyrin IX monomethyl ester cyclase
MKDLISKSDVLLIRPPLHHDSFTMDDAVRIDIPLGLLYLAAVLEKNNHSVSVYDSYGDINIEDFEKIHRTSAPPYLIGSSSDTILQKIQKARPKLLGISCMFNKNLKQVVETAKLIKSHFPDIIIAVGGASITSFTEEILSQGADCIDILCKGEGEKTIIGIMSWLDGKININDIPNSIIKDNHKWIETPRSEYIKELDAIPYPAYDKVDLEHYFKLRQAGFISRHTYNYPNIHKGLVLITSRGCPYNCIFCGNHMHMGRGIRYHSINYIIEHIKYLNSRFGVTHLHIEDDNLNANPKRFAAMLDDFVKLPFKITWDASNGMRADLLADEELLKKIKTSGCNYVKAAVESGDQNVVNKIVKKNIDLQKAEKTFTLCKKLKIDVHSFYIIGFVGETIAQIEKTINFAEQMQKKYYVFPHLQIAEPIKGTELYLLAKQTNCLINDPDGIYPYSIKTGEFDEPFLRKKYLKTFVKNSIWLLLWIIIKNTTLRSFVSNVRFFSRVNKNLPFLSLKEKLYKVILSKTMYVFSNKSL